MFNHQSEDGSKKIEKVLIELVDDDKMVQKRSVKSTNSHNCRVFNEKGWKICT